MSRLETPKNGDQEIEFSPEAAIGDRLTVGGDNHVQGHESERLAAWNREVERVSNLFATMTHRPDATECGPYGAEILYWGTNYLTGQILARINADPQFLNNCKAGLPKGENSGQLERIFEFWIEEGVNGTNTNDVDLFRVAKHLGIRIVIPISDKFQE